MSDLLAPDYSEFDKDDDDDDFLDEYPEDEEETIEIEKILDEQSSLTEELDRKLELDDERDKKIEQMSSNPFQTQNTWNQGKFPWDQNKQQTSNAWGSGGSPFGSSSGSSWWNSGNQQKTQTPPANYPAVGISKKVVICDVLDCLYESWESAGKPNILPRGIFDLKPKFEVWDKIASFNPQRLYIIFPAAELVPGLGSDKRALQITLDYISQSVSTYIRIPKNNCVVLQQMRQFLPKEKSLICAIKDWKVKEDLVYIGTHSGRWGLSFRDVEAARNVGISYIDLFNLLEGKYEYE